MENINKIETINLFMEEFPAIERLIETEASVPPIWIT